MLRRTSFTIVAALFFAAMAALGVALYAASTRTAPTAEEMQKTLLALLQPLTADDAVPCGLMPLGKDIALARSCVETAMSGSKAFWVATQLQGEDSEVWIAVFVSPNGLLRVAHFDSSPHGQPITEPGFYWDADNCSRVEFATDGYPINCV